eukprot:9131092-Alexandrium_andersonii.AAC.1
MQSFNPDLAPRLHPDYVPPTGPVADIEARFQRLGVPRPPDLEDVAGLTARAEALEQAYAARLGTARPPGAL